MLPSRCPFISREVQCIISRCQWMENSRITMLSHLVIWWMNLHKLRCSINLFWKWIVREMFFFHLSKRSAYLERSLLFFSTRTISRWLPRPALVMMWFGSILSKKIKCPGPGAQTFSLFPEGEEGNQSQMPHKCPTNTRGPSSPLDLMLIDF